MKSQSACLPSHLYGQIQTSIALVVALQLCIHGGYTLLCLSDIFLTGLNLQCTDGTLCCSPGPPALC
jgi:hypothetical protein